MCKLKLKTWLLLPSILFFHLVLFGQSRDAILVGVGTNLTELVAGQVNAQGVFIPTNFLGITASAAWRAEQSPIDDFSKEINGWAIGGAIRFFPFGAPRNYDLPEFMRRGFHSSTSYGDSWVQKHLNGLYLSLGYEVRNLSLQMTPGVTLNSPWEDFDYQIKDNGPTAALGYSITLSHFYVDVSYRMRFSQPNWQGPFDIFGDELLTNSYPIAYSRNGALRITVGGAF